MPLPSDQNASGRSFSEKELGYLEQVLEAGTLFAPKGTLVRELEQVFADHLGSDAAVACSSGTAAIHAAVAVIDPEPGDEFITTAVTDMGALTPILYQGAIPVFADVDPHTGNVTAETVADQISERTVGIIATHLFGNPADMEGIMAVAREHDLPVIEDCAQAFGATISGQKVGTFGDLGTFSLQQGKHITSGEGGLIVAGDPAHSHMARLFVNKAWDYDAPSDHDFLALNYRMSELQGAVALAQMAKLDQGVQVRRDNALRLDKSLTDVPGVTPLDILPPAEHSYWRYSVLVDHQVIPGGPVALAAGLRDLGFPSAPRYVQKPAFRCGVFANQKTFGNSRWPFTEARAEAVDYSEDRFPGTFQLLDRILVFPWNERYQPEHVDELSRAIQQSVDGIIGGSE